MKPALVFVAVLLVIQAHAFSSQNALDFAKGFAVGIIEEIPHYITACKQDLAVMQRTFASLEKGFGELASGFRGLNGKDLEHGLKDIAVGIHNTSTMLVDCGIIDDSLGTHKIFVGEEIIIDIAVAELLHKDHPITEHMKTAIRDWQDGKYYESGEALGNIVGLILTGSNPVKYMVLYEKGFEIVSQMFRVSKVNGGEAWDWTADTAGKASDGAKSVAETAWQFMKDTAGKVADGAQDVGGKIADGAKDLGGKVADKTKDVGGKVADGAKDAGEKAADTAKDAAHKVGGWFGW